MERVFSGSHVRVMRGAPRAGVHPVLVVGFEPVLEAHFFRRGEAQGREAEIERIVAGRRRSPAVTGQRHLVCRCLLQHHRRRKAAARVGINRHHAAHGSKPYPPVGSLPDARVPVIAFAAPHALGNVVGDGQNGRDFPIGKIIELLQTETKDAVIGTDPEIALPVLPNIAQFATGKTVFARNRLEVAGAETGTTPGRMVGNQRVPAESW